jgi:F420-dependent oxidoreductase-like protein
MRIGVMVGPERGRYSNKVERLRRDFCWAESAGLATVWIPQIPDEFDALTAAAIAAVDTSRIEIGTAVVPIQPRHPIAMAQQALSVQAICDGRLTLGLGVSHHWVIADMLGLQYDRPVTEMRDYLEVLEHALSGPGVVKVENDHYRVSCPLEVTDVGPTEVLLAALGPRMLRLAGERATGTILWMADQRAIGDYVGPTIRAAAASAGRPDPRIVAGIPVCLCAQDQLDAARARANRILSEAEISPNYQRLMEHGGARDVGDLLVAGPESIVEAQLSSFADAGVTDLAVRVMPVGSTREELLESSRRTRDYLASLGGSL